MYSSLMWKDFKPLELGGQEIEKYFDEKPRDVVLCYGDSDHIIGVLFCYGVRKILEKFNKHVLTVYTEKKGDVVNAGLYTGLLLNVREPEAIVGLWYLNCSKPDVVTLKQCAVYQYRADNEMANVDAFFRCLTIPPVVFMNAAGRVLAEVEESMCHLGFYVYEGRRDEGEEGHGRLRSHRLKQAIHVASALRGSLIVVLVNIDELDSVLRDQYLKHEDSNEMPLFKLAMADTIGRVREVKLITASGDPVAFFDDVMRKRYDMSDVIDGKPELPDLGFSEEKPVDVMLEDDPLELQLRSLRNETCFFCPLDFKTVHQLAGPRSLDDFIRSHKVAFVYFWVNVGTTSKAGLHVLIDSATHLADSLSNRDIGAVGCHDWPDVCTANSVTTWPKLLVYKEGKFHGMYKGLLDSFSVMQAIVLYRGEVITQLHSSEDLEQLASISPGMQIQAVTIFIASSEAASESRDYQLFYLAALALHGSYRCGFFAGDAAIAWLAQHNIEADLPLVITYRSSDTVKRVSMWEKPESDAQTSLQKFIIDSSINSVISLTEQSFPQIFRQHLPVLLLLQKGFEKSTAVFTQLASLSSDLQKTVVFAILDKSTMVNLADKLTRINGIRISDLPAFLLLRPQKGLSYALSNVNEKSAAELINWVDTALDEAKKEELTPTGILEKRSWASRPLMHDYKGMIYGINSRNTRQDSAPVPATTEPVENTDMTRDGSTIDLKRGREEL